MRCCVEQPIEQLLAELAVGTLQLRDAGNLAVNRLVADDHALIVTEFLEGDGVDHPVQ